MCDASREGRILLECLLLSLLQDANFPPPPRLRQQERRRCIVIFFYVYFCYFFFFIIVFRFLFLMKDIFHLIKFAGIREAIPPQKNAPGIFYTAS